MLLKCNIKNMRAKANMSQSRLCEKSGINISMISEYENNKSTPTIYTLWRLAIALGCKVDDLYEVVED